MKPLTILVLAASGLLAQTPQARIKIDTDRRIGEIHPHLFGNFAEHLGRCIYGGIYDEGSPLADDKGYRKDVMEATRNLGVTILRWPGATSPPATTGKTASAPRISARPARTMPGATSTPIGSERMNFSSTAKGSAPNRTSASTPALARSTKPASGSSTPTSRATPTGPICAARTAATSRTTSSTGASATKSTAPGSWATRTPRITPSSPWKRPRPCGAPTSRSS